MDIRNTGRRAMSGIRVIRYGEKAHSLIDVPLGDDFAVEVGYDGDVQGCRTASDPIFAELVTVASMDWLDRVAQLVENSRKGLERPAGTTLGFPSFTVILEGTE